MKCKNCGHENKDKSKFCIKCGSSLDSGESSSNTSKVVIVALVVVILLLVSVIGYFAINLNSSDNVAVSGLQSEQSEESSESVNSDLQNTTVESSSVKTKSWELIGSYSGSGSGSQTVSVPSGQIKIELSAYPIKNYATNHLYVSGSNGKSAGVDWGSNSAVETRADSISYNSSDTETFTIDYYETVSWEVEFYRYQ